VLPGTAFGPGGEGYLRLCFANSMENIELALQRMSSALAAL
jgi:aspartate/methionine/tyrosine aminotransferase